MLVGGDAPGLQPPPLSLIPTLFQPPYGLTWVLYPCSSMVVGGGGGCGRGGKWWQRKALVARSALGLTEFLTPFQFVCLAALATNSLNYLKYYSALAIHI